ncbi:MAG TPA: hypothetical protein DIU07_00080 [Rhodobacteraceae bacterium]|nr:hypothetical protein [Paracoccaceae bacterium]
MTDKVASPVARIQNLEEELAEELERRRKSFTFRLELGRVTFEQEVRARHRAFKKELSTYILQARPLVVLTAPFIFLVIVPFVLLDLFASLYQLICFPVYRIEKVRRAEYITFDRHHLSYLNALEKLNCVYCAYANGLLAYVREIAARTERHWCPIKHAKLMTGVYGHYAEFVEYGDAEGFQRDWVTPQDPST